MALRIRKEAMTQIARLVICLDHGRAVSPVRQHMARRSDFDHGRGRAVPLAVRDDGVVCLRSDQSRGYSSLRSSASLSARSY